MKRRAVLHKLTPEITCIDDAGDSVCYVVCGKDKAAVIDTVNGRENLYDIVHGKPVGTLFARLRICR